MKKSISTKLLTIICLLTAFMGLFLSNSTEAKAASLSNPRISDGVSTWDCVWFGNYYQSDITGKKKDPIKWRVLSINGNDAFLVADQNLDVQRYNETMVNVTWETCTLRSWLNGYGSSANQNSIDYSKENFINTAFTMAEQNAIFSTKVVNENNPRNGTAGGNDTQDKIYLLSLGEVKNTAYGFPSYDDSSNTRASTTVPYVASKDAWMIPIEWGNWWWWWWLRSPGIYSNWAAVVDHDGSVSISGDYVYCYDFAVRPALHLNLLSSHLWSYAGTVSSDGSKNEVEPNFGNNTQPTSPTQPAKPTVRKVSKITITGNSKKIAYGKKVSLKAKISPSNASDQSVTWKSSNKKYADVSSKGVVTTKKAGKGKNVTITAVAKDGSSKKATYKIQIMKGAVKKISISGKKSVKAGKSIKLKSKVTASKGANKKVKWTSSNSKYATVSSSGKVTAKKAGKGKKVKITGTATDGSGKKKTVTIKIR